MLRQFLTRSTLAGALALAPFAVAQAETFGFDSVATGDYSSLTTGGVTFTSTNGFSVVDASPGAPISGHALANFEQGLSGVFKATFSGAGVSTFSIGMGDYNADEDLGHLEAYDASGQLLDSDSLYVDPSVYGGSFMTVSSSSPIAYVLFYETGSYPGVVFWDQASFTAAVPEPASTAMMLAGLATLAGLRRRRGKTPA